jgi:hypothetical protein
MRQTGAIDQRRRGKVGQNPGHRRAGVKQRQQQSMRPQVADPAAAVAMLRPRLPAGAARLRRERRDLANSGL